MGVINRMDRQFNRDKVPNRGESLGCGEISAIYRFAYEGNLPSGAIGEKSYKSRLPVTLNIVFPARPWSKEVTCAEVAQRWLDYAKNQRQAGTDAASLRNLEAQLVVSSLKAADIDRIELNMQGSRVSAGSDTTDFGTLGTYIIRVFRSTPDPKGGRWKPSYLTNQIDRARLLDGAADENTCEEKKKNKISRSELVAYLLSMNPRDGDKCDRRRRQRLAQYPATLPGVPGDIDIAGGRQPIGKSAVLESERIGAEQIITDGEIDTALKQYKKKNFPRAWDISALSRNFGPASMKHRAPAVIRRERLRAFRFPGEGIVPELHRSTPFISPDRRTSSAISSGAWRSLRPSPGAAGFTFPALAAS